MLRVDDENNPNKKAFVLDFIETKQYDNQDKDVQTLEDLNF